MGRTPHRLGVVIVRCVKQNARSFEPRVHDLAAHGRRSIDIVALDLRDFAESAVRVEGKRRFAGGGEEQIIGKLHGFTLRQD